MKSRFLVPFLALLLVGLFAISFAQPWYARGDFNAFDTSAQMLDDGVAPDATASDGIFTVDVFSTLGGGPGHQEWKAADSGWTTSYPGQNSRIYIAAADTTYTLTLNTNPQGDGWVPDQNFVSYSPITDVEDGPFTAVGSYNGGEWDPAAAANHMRKAPDGTFFLYKEIATAGTYEYKVAFNDAWEIQIGANGWEDNASTTMFTTTVADQVVRLKADPILGRLAVDLTPDLSVKINELNYDDASTDDEEFIELYGPPSKDLTGWTLELVNGNGGAVYAPSPIALTAIPADGYLVISYDTATDICDICLSGFTIQNGGPDAMRLLDADGNIVDALGYETRDGFGGLITGDYEGPLGYKGACNNGGWDTNNYSLSRAHDGFDSDDNQIDFTLLPASPGISNDTPRGLAPAYVNNFDDAAGTSYPDVFWGYYVDPFTTGPSVANYPPIASPQGGNFAVFSDPSGGGDVSTYMSEAIDNVILECYAYINPVVLPGGDAEYWSIIVRGETDHVYNNPTLTYNAQTGIIWQFKHDDSGSTLTLEQKVANVTEVVYIEQKMDVSYTGWQRLRVEVEGDTVTGYLGGTYGTTTAPVTGSGTTRLVAGGIGFGFREYVTDNVNSTPWLCLDAMNIAEIPPAGVDDWMMLE